MQESCSHSVPQTSRYAISSGAAASGRIHSGPPWSVNRPWRAYDTLRHAPIRTTSIQGLHGASIGRGRPMTLSGTPRFGPPPFRASMERQSAVEGLRHSQVRPNSAYSALKIPSARRLGHPEMGSHLAAPGRATATRPLGLSSRELPMPCRTYATPGNSDHTPEAAPPWPALGTSLSPSLKTSRPVQSRASHAMSTIRHAGEF